MGDYLSVGVPGGSYHYGIVTSVGGTGPYTCGIVWQGGQSAKAAGTPVRATMQGGGLHPGPVAHAHALYAQAVIDWKRSRGWVPTGTG